MQVKSILQYFRPSISYCFSLRSLFCLFLSGRLRSKVLLYIHLSDCWLSHCIVSRLSSGPYFSLLSFICSYFSYFFMKMPYYPYFFTLKCKIHVKIQKFFLARSDFISIPMYISGCMLQNISLFHFYPQKSLCSACTIVTSIILLIWCEILISNNSL